MNKTVIYQMLPRLWGSRNNSESGRFDGVDKPTLDHIKSLGAGAVWYTGVIRHSQNKPFVKGAAGSPYAICDYYDVNPYLATDPDRRMEEFESLVKRTHESGLKVIIDFVPNHVGRDNVNFGQDDDKSVHWTAENDFYYYPGEALRLPTGGEYKEIPARASGNCFTSAPGINDWYETVRLNYCDFHTQTWDKMLEILRFWASKGVDGFRCDMVEMVPWQFFAWLIPTLKKEFPEIIFIAEVYCKELYWKYINEVGFDLLYDKSGLYDTLRAVLQYGSDARTICSNWQMLGSLQPNMLNFLENHDEQRVASEFFAGKPERAYAALGVSLLQNTAPFMLYFGEEVGERGMDAEGFSGRDGRTTIFDWWAPKGLRDLCASVHGSGELSAEQRSVLDRHRTLLQLAVSVRAFSEGRMFDLCYCNEYSAGVDPTRTYMFLRSDGKSTYLVAANFSPRGAEMTIRIPSEAADYLGVALPESVRVTVAPEDCSVIKL